MANQNRHADSDAAPRDLRGSAVASGRLDRLESDVEVMRAELGSVMAALARGTRGDSSVAPTSPGRRTRLDVGERIKDVADDDTRAGGVQTPGQGVGLRGEDVAKT